MSDERVPSGSWTYPTHVLFGVGRIADLPEACKSVRVTRPLLVTDPVVAELPMVGEAIDACRSAGLGAAVFSGVRSNPLGDNVLEGVEAFRNNGHDGVIAFGGGSSMDVGKLIAFMQGQTHSMWDFEDKGDNWKRANSDTIAPVVAVPTTAGTGSEVGRAAVATDESGTKRILYHPRMMPRVVIADPALSVGVPKNVTAGTGMDALSHCFEAYCSPAFHPMADGIAAEGMRLIKDWLPIAVRDGGNVLARAHMLAAAGMGATAFQKGLGAIHALSHPVGSIYDCHHGTANAVFLPYVMVFNRPAIEEKCVRLAGWLGLEEPTFDACLKWVLDLREEIGMPHTARELGVEADELDHLAEMAIVDPSAPTNPVPLDAASLKKIFLKALDGDLSP